MDEQRNSGVFDRVHAKRDRSGGVLNQVMAQRWKGKYGVTLEHAPIDKGRNFDNDMLGAGYRWQVHILRRQDTDNVGGSYEERCEIMKGISSNQGRIDDTGSQKAPRSKPFREIKNRGIEKISPLYIRGVGGQLARTYSPESRDSASPSRALARKNA
ncbi:hypothetical protein BC834DRAFT_396151 [Gloeopeniophorella convolvens]|nr:hypothetical protein BC834DRAFT_396151 [Gloeopeniophorella convolvens]